MEFRLTLEGSLLLEMLILEELPEFEAFFSLTGLLGGSSKVSKSSYEVTDPMEMELALDIRY